MVLKCVLSHFKPFKHMLFFNHTPPPTTHSARIHWNLSKCFSISRGKKNFFSQNVFWHLRIILRGTYIFHTLGRGGGSGRCGKNPHFLFFFFWRLPLMMFVLEPKKMIHCFQRRGTKSRWFTISPVSLAVVMVIMNMQCSSCNVPWSLVSLTSIFCVIRGGWFFLKWARLGSNESFSV